MMDFAAMTDRPLSFGSNGSSIFRNLADKLHISSGEKKPQESFRLMGSDEVEKFKESAHQYGQEIRAGIPGGPQGPGHHEDDDFDPLDYGGQSSHDTREDLMHIGGESGGFFSTIDPRDQPQNRSGRIWLG